MNNRFSGQAVLITGGSMGIGEGCARVFAAEGGQVAICSRRPEPGKRLAEELTAAGPGSCWYLQADVTQPTEIERAVLATVERFGGLDCLINNAGWHPPAMAIDETSVEEFESLVRLNLTSTFVGCKAALPHLRKTRGAIVNISSMVGLLGQANAAAYCATKAGQIGLTKALAVDFAPYGVRVNAVCPAGVDTPLLHAWAATLADPVEGLRRTDQMHKLGRMATPAEIGRVCLFLATADSSFVTGQAIEVEGGASLDY